MIFRQSHLAFRVLDVLRIDQKKHGYSANSGRHFCALSYREETDAVITCGDEVLPMQADSVTFFPADTDYQREASVDRMTVIHFELYNYTGRQICPLPLAYPEQVQVLFDAALAEWNRGDPAREYRVTAILNEIFALLYGECTRNESAMPELLQQAVAYIEQRYADPALTVPAVAAELNICDVYLRRLFARHLHVSPKQYITDLRIRRAAALLTSGYYTVGEIARLVGFREEKYFSVAFHRAVGCPPSRYVYEFEG